MFNSTPTGSREALLLTRLQSTSRGNKYNFLFLNRIYPSPSLRLLYLLLPHNTCLRSHIHIRSIRLQNIHLQGDIHLLYPLRHLGMRLLVPLNRFVCFLWVSYSSDHREPLFPGQVPDRSTELDGGGIRGMGSLHVLKAIMDKIGKGSKPCRHFDIIAGSSTGG